MFCTECGTSVSPSWKFCQSCGAKIPASSQFSGCETVSYDNADCHDTDTIRAAGVGGDVILSPRPPSAQARPASGHIRNAARVSQSQPSSASSSVNVSPRLPAAARPTSGGHAHVLSRSLGGHSARQRPQSGNPGSPAASSKLPTSEVGSPRVTHKSSWQSHSRKSMEWGWPSANNSPASSSSAARPMAVADVLDAIAQSLRDYCKENGLRDRTFDAWAQFFPNVDRMHFEEFDSVVRKYLCAKVSRYDILLFWQRMDANGSGVVTLAEFWAFMYRIDLCRWPDISITDLDRCAQILSAAAEKWHKAGGNWFRVFNTLDFDSNGVVTFDELRKCVWGRFPALQLTKKEISETQLQGFWKALDVDCSRDVSVCEFMAFMRKHASIHSMHKLTEYSKKRRHGDTPAPDMGETPKRTRAQMRAVVAALNKALRQYWAKRGSHANTICEGGDWRRFFDELDLDTNGRADYAEFSTGVRSRLGRSFESQAGDDDVRALWALMDANGSGAVTWKELTSSLYRLEVEEWPDLDEKNLTRVVDEMNAAIDKWHGAAGNWYKLFCVVDPEVTGEIAFDNFRELVRGRFPALCIPPNRISDDDIRSFWKVLDHGLTGGTTVHEFVVFMRRRGTQRSVRRLADSRTAGLAIGGRDAQMDTSAVQTLDRGQLLIVAKRVASALPKLFEWAKKDKSGRLTYLEFENACGALLTGHKMTPVAELKAFWHYVDSEGKRELTLAQLNGEAYRLKLETWPKLTKSDIVRIVEELDAATEKWHRESGNWFKVFTCVHKDGSGMMDYEEMVRVVRSPFPGLSIQPKQIGDTALKGLWRAIDAESRGHVAGQDFMRFMRLHGRSFTMRKQATEAQHKDTINHQSLPERTREQIEDTVRALGKALNAYWVQRGVHAGVAGDWSPIFDHADSAHHGRVTFAQLERGVRERLQRHPVTQGPASSAASAFKGEVVKGVQHDDLYALWALADVNSSGEVSATEWQVCLYRITVNTWPDGDEACFSRVVQEMDVAADRWHQAAGNWYKLFQILDANNSGRLSFEELKTIVRRKLPCLAIPRALISDNELRALWKALDVDRMGEITWKAFLQFMRRYGQRQSPRPGGVLYLGRFAGFWNQSGREEPWATSRSGATVLSSEQVTLLRRALASEDYESFAASYERLGMHWDSTVSEYDLRKIVRDILGLSEEHFDDDAIFAVRQMLPWDNGGRVCVQELLDVGKASDK